MENNNLSLETFQDQLNILKLQNQLLNQCRINTSINVSMSIEECAYSVGNGNIYPFQVPHYCLHYTSIKNRVDEYFKDLNSIVSPIDLFNIMEIIASIQAPPERIHIGFLDFDYLRRSELYKIYYPLIDYLEKKNYDLCGSFCFGPGDIVADDDFCMSNFLWDDSIFETIDVLIDTFSNKSQCFKNIQSFITMDNSFVEQNLGSRLIYISIHHCL